MLFIDFGPLRLKPVDWAFHDNYKYENDEFVQEENNNEQDCDCDCIVKTLDGMVYI